MFPSHVIFADVWSESIPGMFFALEILFRRVKPQYFLTEFHKTHPFAWYFWLYFWLCFFWSTLVDTHFCWINQMFITEGHFSTFSGTHFFSHLDTLHLGRLGSDFPKTHSCWKQDYNAYMGESLDLGWDFDTILTIEMTWFFVFYSQGILPRLIS